MPGPPPRNPGDYAWGPQGLDNIISQMLANLEDPGPPPADKDKVKALPTVVATEENLKECELEEYVPWAHSQTVTTWWNTHQGMSCVSGLIPHRF